MRRWRAKGERGKGEVAEPLVTQRSHVEWFHGSPQRLEVLRAGSTVTPVVELARAFSHKPTLLAFDVAERDDQRTATIEHNGTAHGHLHRVVVADPAADLRQHPTSAFAPGEEMLTTRDLPLEFLAEVPVEEGPIVIVEPAPPGDGAGV